MFCIFYALFVLFSLSQNVSCNNRGDAFIQNGPEMDHVVARYKRNEHDTPDPDYGVTEHEPKADKLIQKPSLNLENRPARNQIHDDGRFRAQAPVWTNPQLMQREVFVKPLNEIVSKFLFI